MTAPHDPAVVAALVAEFEERLALDGRIALSSVARFGVRTRSPLMREVLAKAGQTGVLGRVIALSSEPDAYERGMELLERSIEQTGREGATEEIITLWAQLLLRTGRTEEVAELLADPDLLISDHHRWALRTDLANPFLLPRPSGDPDSAQVRWLETFNEVHVPHGLEPITVVDSPTQEAPYHRLTAPTTGSVDGELVSVVMSAFQPQRADLMLALRSVLEQTWRNLEVLVVDDASGPDSTALLEEAEALDDRIRVIRAPENQGTYAARNLALTLARGRWMTFHDSDDWAHPRRIELQVRQLEGEADLLANRTWTLRAFPDLTLTYPGYPAERLNASSLLFDIAEVTRLVGTFDAIRKSGDVELPLRLQAVRPHSVAEITDPSPLAITQLRTNSLSRGDSIPGWIRWDRLAYRDAYREWHRQIKVGRASPILPLPSGRRPFPLPHASWAPRRPTQPTPERWDVVVASDLRWKAAGVRRALGVARSLSQAGHRTAMAHAESTLPMSGALSTILPALSADLREGRMGLTDVHEPDDCSLLVITEPSGVLHLDAAVMRPHRVLVVADQAEPTGWTVPDVDRRVRELFGVDPTWGGPAAIHGSASDPSLVRRGVPANRWQDADLAVTTGVGWQRVGPAGSMRAHDRRLAGSPVRPFVALGHHLADSERRWPTTAEGIAAAYPDQLRVPDGRTSAVLPAEIHAWQGLGRAQQTVGADLRPPHWVSFAAKDMAPREFLSHLDVWVYVGEWDDVAELGLLEALAAGLPCVVGPGAAHLPPSGLLRTLTGEDSREAVEDLLSMPAAASATATLADLRQSAWGSTVASLLTEPASAPVITVP